MKYFSVPPSTSVWFYIQSGTNLQKMAVDFGHLVSGTKVKCEENLKIFVKKSNKMNN